MTTTLLKKVKAKRRITNGKACVYCGCTNPLIMTVDHKTPLSRGGKDTKENKQPCCFVCNNLKSGLLHSEAVEYFKALKKLHRLCKIRISNLPQRIELKFSQQHHPDFEFKPTKQYVDSTDINKVKEEAKKFVEKNKKKDEEKK